MIKNRLEIGKVKLLSERKPPFNVNSIISDERVKIRNR
jgi:hypothetical protein